MSTPSYEVVLSEQQRFYNAKILQQEIADNPENLTGITRAGIIPYMLDDKGEMTLLFGVDAGSAQLTDFGGKVEKIDGNPLDAAIREFHEETLGIFADFQHLSEGKIFYSLESKAMVFFLRLEHDQQQAIDDFANAFEKRNAVCEQESESTDNPTSRKRVSELNALIYLSQTNVGKLLDRHQERFFFKVIGFLRCFLEPPV